MRKLALLFLIVFLGSLFLPLVSLAGFYQADSAGVCYDGLVPCGKRVCVGAFNKDSCRDLLKEVQRKVKEEKESPNEAFRESCTGELKEIRCQFCHFFVMLDGIIDFTIKYIVIPVAVLMLVVGGVMFFFAGARPDMMARGKKLITSVVIGLVIIFASYLIVGVVLAAMGLADTNPIKGWFSGDAFTVNCPIKLQAAGNGGGNGGNGGNGDGNGEEEEEEEEACDKCGEGWFNVCDVSGCHDLAGTGGKGCHFKDGYCYECTGGDHPVNSCPDYFSQQSCEADICGTGESCLWDEDEGSCTSMSILCEDWQKMADYFNVPYSARRSGDLENFLTCLGSRTMQALPSEGEGNDFYGSLFTWDHDHEACNYNRGDTACSACSHTHYSCHYGGGTGTDGALAVDFGNELNIIPIRDAANQCCQDIWDEDCFILLEGDPPLQHIHISIPPCGRN